jgi:hypothetical protein
VRHLPFGVGQSMRRSSTVEEIWFWIGLIFGKKGTLGVGVYSWESTSYQISPLLLVWSVGCCCQSRDIMGILYY